MLAYSSIGQAGFVMIGLTAGTDAGYSSMIFYLLIYLFMNLGAFACVILFALRTGTDQIAEYSGLYQKDPLLTLCLSICLLSLGGIPPLAGFFGKIYLFWAGWQAGLYALVLVGLVTSVASIYYYIRVVKMMVVKEPQEMSDAVKNYPVINWTLTGMRPLQVGIDVRCGEKLPRYQLDSYRDASPTGGYCPLPSGDFPGRYPLQSSLYPSDGFRHHYPHPTIGGPGDAHFPSKLKIPVDLSALSDQNNNAYCRANSGISPTPNPFLIV